MIVVYFIDYNGRSLFSTQESLLDQPTILSILSYFLFYYKQAVLSLQPLLISTTIKRHNVSVHLPPLSRVRAHRQLDGDEL
jgi:hypothetical protein